MNKPKHTPGPWKVEVHHTRMQVWNQNTHIASIAEQDHSYELNEANARLIAAAPELLEALNEALWLISVSQCPETHHERNIVIKGQRAIAKATGGAK